MNPDPKKTDQLMNQKSYTENCVPDEDIMKYKPVRMTFFHYDRSTSKRKLLWHDGDAKTGVNLHVDENRGVVTVYINTECENSCDRAS